MYNVSTHKFSPESQEMTDLDASQLTFYFGATATESFIHQLLQLRQQRRRKKREVGP